jgi:hypothetical protein
VEVTGKWRGCRYYSVVRYTIVNRSHRSRHMGEGWVANKIYEPVSMLFFKVYHPTVFFEIITRLRSLLVVQTFIVGHYSVRTAGWSIAKPAGGMFGPQDIYYVSYLRTIPPSLRSVKRGKYRICSYRDIPFQNTSVPYPLESFS